MKILGIDYGKKKIGLALAEGPLAEPWKVIRFDDLSEAVRKIKTEIETEKPDRIIVGISEGAMAEETRKFLSAICNQLPAIKFETFDETLTTQEAQKLAIEAGISRKKRKEMEDAYAASLMLQLYLDSNV